MIRGLAAALLLSVAAPAAASPVLLVSLDGLRPGDVTRAAARGLTLPVLARLQAEGAHADGVIGVLPTLTYPSHTTLLTGTSPRRHGVGNNLTFDPRQENDTGWYWYAEDVRVPTLWQAAHSAGLSTANVHWPVSVGAAGVDFNLPQIWRKGTGDDRKLLRALATPGLLPALEAKLGPYAQGIDESVAGDAVRVRFAVALIAERKPQFTTVYLAGIDHAEHHDGVGSPGAIRAIEQTDALVGELVAAARAAMPDVTVAIVSDHGFRAVATDVNLFRPFVAAGLMTLDAANKPARWEAMPWLAGGTAAIRLARPDDPALVTRVAALLARLAADPTFHIAAVLDARQVAAAGGDANASFFVAMQPGFETGRDPAAPTMTPSTYRGMHGYLPSDPAMRSTLIVAGPRIARGRDLGTIDMRAIAPSLARVLGVALPSAEAPPAF